MNQKKQTKGLKLDDWKLWFRLGTIGFLLLFATRGNSQELQLLPAPTEEAKQTTKQAGKASLIITDEKKKKGLPVLIAPSEKKEDVSKKKPTANPENPAEIAPMPVIAPQQTPQSPLKKKGAKKSGSAKKNLKKKLSPKQTPADSRTEQWSILITPGVSSHPAVKPKPSVTTFQLDRKTGKMTARSVRHEVGRSKKQEAGHSKNKATPPKSGELEMIDPMRKKESDRKRLPEIHPNTNVIHPKVNKVEVDKYEQIYNSIPYSRAEYLANPAYRHEATMELLLGTLRPTVVQKQDRPKRVYNQPRLNEAVPRTSPPPMPFGYYPGYYRGYYYPGYYPGYYRGYYGGYGGYYGGFGYRGGYRPYSSLYRYGHTRYGYGPHRYGYGYPY